MKKNKKMNKKMTAPMNVGLDFSHMGFALDHQNRVVYVLEWADTAILNGNEVLQNKFLELHEKYPTYTGGILHIMFVG